jgi:hypothetical protein
VGDRMGRRQAEGAGHTVQAPPLLLLRVTTLPLHYSLFLTSRKKDCRRVSVRVLVLGGSSSSL